MTASSRMSVFSNLAYWDGYSGSKMAIHNDVDERNAMYYFKNECSVNSVHEMQKRRQLYKYIIHPCSCHEWRVIWVPRGKCLFLHAFDAPSDISLPVWKQCKLSKSRLIKFIIQIILRGWWASTFLMAWIYVYQWYLLEGLINIINIVHLAEQAIM